MDWTQVLAYVRAAWDGSTAASLLESVADAIDEQSPANPYAAILRQAEPWAVGSADNLPLDEFLSAIEVDLDLENREPDKTITTLEVMEAVGRQMKLVLDGPVAAGMRFPAARRSGLKQKPSLWYFLAPISDVLYRGADCGGEGVGGAGEDIPATPPTGPGPQPTDPWSTA